MRSLIPGQVAWDQARTSYANGDTLGTVVGSTAMVAEAATTAVTFGYAGAAKQGIAHSTKVAVKGSTPAQAVTKTVEAARKPVVVDFRLSKIVDDLYKGGTNPNRFVGGTTMSAAAHELAGGAKVHGRDHVLKLRESLRSLQNCDRKVDSSIIETDRSTAHELIGEIQKILGYK